MEAPIIFYICIYTLLGCMIAAGVCLHVLNHIMIRDMFEIIETQKSPLSVTIPSIITHLSIFGVAVIVMNPYSIRLIGETIFQNKGMTVIAIAFFILPTSAIQATIFSIFTKRKINSRLRVLDIDPKNLNIDEEELEPQH